MFQCAHCGVCSCVGAVLAFAVTSRFVSVRLRGACAQILATPPRISRVPSQPLVSVRASVSPDQWRRVLLCPRHQQTSAPHAVGTDSELIVGVATSLKSFHNRDCLTDFRAPRVANINKVCTFPMYPFPWFTRLVAKLSGIRSVPIIHGIPRSKRTICTLSGELQRHE
eukprot:1867506-Amphidinium_carterae.1